MFRYETEKLRDTEQSRHAQFQGDLESKIEELKAQMDTLRNAQDLSKGNERDEGILEQLRATTTTFISAYEGGMEEFRQDLE